MIEQLLHTLIYTHIYFCLYYIRKKIFSINELEKELIYLTSAYKTVLIDLVTPRTFYDDTNLHF